MLCLKLYHDEKHTKKTKRIIFIVIFFECIGQCRSTRRVVCIARADDEMDNDLLYVHDAIYLIFMFLFLLNLSKHITYLLELNAFQ